MRKTAFLGHSAPVDKIVYLLLQYFVKCILCYTDVIFNNNNNPYGQTRATERGFWANKLSCEILLTAPEIQIPNTHKADTPTTQKLCF